MRDPIRQVIVSTPASDTESKRIDAFQRQPGELLFERAFAAKQSRVWRRRRWALLVGGLVGLGVIGALMTLEVIGVLGVPALFFHPIFIVSTLIVLGVPIFRLLRSNRHRFTSLWRSAKGTIQSASMIMVGLLAASVMPAKLMVNGFTSLKALAIHEVVGLGVLTMLGVICCAGGLRHGWQLYSRVGRARHDLTDPVPESDYMASGEVPFARIRPPAQSDTRASLKGGSSTSESYSPSDSAV